MNREGQTMKKTFKTLTALFATATLAFGLTACNDKEPAKDGAKTISSLEQIQKDGKVRIGVFSDKPPFGYVDAQGKSQGFDVEIGKAIGKDLLGDENKVEFVLVDAANRAEYLLSKKVDIILANFTVTPARKEVVDFANPYMKRVVEKLRSLGKTMIITSDMYLGKDEIKKLLAHCGYGTFAHYFISCEYGKSKHDGSIYQEIKNSCKNSEKIIHIGDNKVSDKKQAEKNGIEAVWYPNVNEAGAVYRSEDMSKVGGSIYRGLVNSWLYNGMKAYSMPYEYGFIYGGIFVLGYCQWIHQYVKEHEIEKILFLSRDGDILSKVYETLYPEEIGKWNYVYWSRIAATKMTAAYFKYDYFRRFLYHKVNQGYSLKAIFQSMELEDLLYDFLQESRHKGKTENSVLDEKTAEEVKQFLQENWKDVLAHYQTQIQMGKQYFGEILRECASVAVVDIGWAGSGAVSLDYLINEVWGMQCNVTGLVAGTNTIFNQEPDASESFLYSGDNLAAEMLLASPTYSFRRFNEDGTLKFAEHEIEIDAKEVQDGIIDFVKWYLMRMQKIPKISGRDAYAPLLTVLSNEEYFRNLLRTEKVQMNLE